MATDSTPTPRYDQFRNAETQGFAIAEGMKEAYSELFERNEYVYDLTREKISSLVIEITGASKTDQTVLATVGTFVALNELADFDGNIQDQERSENNLDLKNDQQNTNSSMVSRRSNSDDFDNDDVNLKVSYNINLNLPESTNPEVFNAIFRSLKEHLLKN